MKLKEKYKIIRSLKDNSGKEAEKFEKESIERPRTHQFYKNLGLYKRRRIDRRCLVQNTSEGSLAAKESFGRKSVASDSWIKDTLGITRPQSATSDYFSLPSSHSGSPEPIRRSTPSRKKVKKSISFLEPSKVNNAKQENSRATCSIKVSLSGNVSAQLSVIYHQALFRVSLRIRDKREL